MKRSCTDVPCMCQLCNGCLVSRHVRRKHTLVFVRDSTELPTILPQTAPFPSNQPTTSYSNQDVGCVDVIEDVGGTGGTDVGATGVGCEDVGDTGGTITEDAGATGEGCEDVVVLGVWKLMLMVKVGFTVAMQQLLHCMKEHQLLCYMLL